MKQTIETKLGVIIILIFAMTAGAFLWKWEKNQPSVEQSQMTYAIKKPITKMPDNQATNNDVAQAKEFPTVDAQEGMSLEDISKQLLYKRYPNWKIENYNVNVSVETKKENYAIGRFSYDGGEQNKKGEGIWFVAKSNENWTLVTTSSPGYWGFCQDFKKYNFPSDMTPDCWDTEKNVLVDTSNPKRFYADKFTKADKKELIDAFIEYAKNGSEDGSGYWREWLVKELYVKVNKSVGNYLMGSILIGGSQNISAAEFFAIKQFGKWIVVYNGQDSPPCSITSQYNFPKEIITRCR